MSKQKVQDAWDDDWEPDATPVVLESSKPEPPLTQAERLARHKELNRKIWQSADSPDDMQYLLPATNNVTRSAPVFKPAMKVLSRRPVENGDKSGTVGLDEETPKEAKPSPEEIRLRQQREREEKQRRYDEARAKIFGEPVLPATASPSQSQQQLHQHLQSNPSSGASTPGNITPPQQQQQNQRGGGGGGGRGGKAGGGRGSHRGSSSGNNNYNNNRVGYDRSNTNGDGQPQTTRRPPGTRELYDPNYSLKPQQKRGGGGVGDNATSSSSQRSTTPRIDEVVLTQAIRAPKGPDGSGRSGFGFARREAKDG